MVSRGQRIKFRVARTFEACRQHVPHATYADAERSARGHQPSICDKCQAGCYFTPFSCQAGPHWHVGHRRPDWERKR